MGSEFLPRSGREPHLHRCHRLQFPGFRHGARTSAASPPAGAIRTLRTVRRGPRDIHSFADRPRCPPGVIVRRRGACTQASTHARKLLSPGLSAGRHRTLVHGRTRRSQPIRTESEQSQPIQRRNPYSPSENRSALGSIQPDHRGIRGRVRGVPRSQHGRESHGDREPSGDRSGQPRVFRSRPDSILGRGSAGLPRWPDADLQTWYADIPWLAKPIRAWERSAPRQGADGRCRCGLLSARQPDEAASACRQ